MNTKSTSFAVVCIAVIAIAGYLVFLSKDETPLDGIVSPKDIKKTGDRTNITSLYSIETPNEWYVEHEEAVNGRLSYLKAESSDWQTESSDNINASTHIVAGALLEVYVSDQDIGRPSDSLRMAIQLETSKPFMIDDNEHLLHIYREYDPPKEGLVLEAPVQHGSNFYTFRFAYNPVSYPRGEEVFMRILNSLRFAP